MQVFRAAGARIVRIPCRGHGSHELDIVRIVYRIEDEASVYGLEQGEIGWSRGRIFHDIVHLHLILIKVYFFMYEAFLFPQRQGFVVRDVLNGLL